MVGGLARTQQYKGFYFDMGGHRFFAKSPEVKKLKAFNSLKGLGILVKLVLKEG